MNSKKSVDFQFFQNIIGFLLVLVIFFLFNSKIYSTDACALLIGKYKKDCIIIRSGKISKKPKRMMELFAGDKIIQKSDVEKIKIKCSPFTFIKKLNDTTLEIAHKPPKVRRSIFGELTSFLGFEKEKHESNIAVTRDTGEKFKDSRSIFFPKPGYWATVFAGEPILFSWDRKGIKTIVIRDSTGKEIFRKEFGKGAFIELMPQEIKMKPDMVYYWEIEIKGIPRKSETFCIKLLDDMIGNLISADLDKIKNEKTSKIEKMFKTAAYLQFVSDIYPKEADLYWKSFQILIDINESELNVKNRELCKMLIERYFLHLENQLVKVSGKNL